MSMRVSSQSGWMMISSNQKSFHHTILPNNNYKGVVGASCNGITIWAWTRHRATWEVMRRIFPRGFSPRWAFKEANRLALHWLVSMRYIRSQFHIYSFLVPATTFLDVKIKRTLLWTKQQQKWTTVLASTYASHSLTMCYIAIISDRGKGELGNKKQEVVCY